MQPLLRRHCQRCHGPKHDEGGLRLNRRVDAIGEADSDLPIVVPGHAEKSLLISRLVDTDAGELMPLDGEPLSLQEVDLLRQWIDEGAAWPEAKSKVKHWAYEAIRRPDVPAHLTTERVIDHFIDQKIATHGLVANPRMQPASVARRASLALIGLPPKPSDPKPSDTEQLLVGSDAVPGKAYSSLVDRLLASPRYGERWAVPWLDLARYADSNGFQADQIRDNWAYRDWVIRAFNQGMPFDEFVTDQLAGDLRPDATLDQRIATGFHRMTTCNVEAGVHPEANRVNQVVDRVNTTATVFLGTTLECAQCHDHKYDPFSQKDYYRFFAYFNNTPLEVKQTAGVTWDFYGPKLDLPLEEDQEQKLADQNAKLRKLRLERAKVATELDASFEDWLTRLGDQAAPLWEPVQLLDFKTSGNEVVSRLPGGAVLLTGDVPPTVDHAFTLKPPVKPVTAIRVELLTDDAIPGSGPGRGEAARPNVILSEVTCEVISGNEKTKVALSTAAADYSQPKWDVARAIDGDRKTGWAIGGQFGKPHWATFMLAKPMLLDPDSQSLRVSLGQYFGSGRVAGKPRVSVTTQSVDILLLPDALRNMLKGKKLSKQQRNKLRTEFEKVDERLVELDQSITRVENELKKLVPETTLVMQEMASPRETFVMLRGDYEARGDVVEAMTPSALPRGKAVVGSGDRMELARWLTSAENPLLARVTVNRWWAEIFGAGLVPTLEDFGTQSDTPSHPELLDWLASELIESGWSMKHIHKLMVISDAFQRSAALTEVMVAKDPVNRYLARGPRFRLPAEMIRDNALAISGLLSEKMYGPPIMPYQPDKIWRSVGRNQPKWVAAKDEDRFRRGAYVVWKRAAPYPSFINFDAPDRGTCTVSRGRSNTPLQALTLLNDPAYIEMALALADRVISESPSSDDRERLRYAIRLAVSRDAEEHEIGILMSLLSRERDDLKSKPQLVKARTTVSVPALELRTTDMQELAAWLAVANAILNLDETMNQ
ncbi:MAG: hypothetical protein CMM01_27035 [Rhodopirellula sp.]|nr:hypothetical protein [Rhodopirellula sp.]